MIENEVWQWVSEDYDDDKEAALRDLSVSGCASGVVSGLIYYEDTSAFYERNKEEIAELLVEYGITDMADAFQQYWDLDDPLALERLNQNTLAWFGFETVAYRILEDVAC